MTAALAGTALRDRKTRGLESTRECQTLLGGRSASIAPGLPRSGSPGQQPRTRLAVLQSLQRKREVGSRETCQMPYLIFLAIKTRVL